MNAAVKKPRKKIEKRVVWTLDERELVSRKTVDLLTEKYGELEEVPEMRDSDFAAYVDRAQVACLPEDRRRKGLSFSSLVATGIDREVWKMIEVAHAKRKATSTPVTVVAAPVATPETDSFSPKSLAAIWLASAEGKKFTLELRQEMKNMALKQAQKDLEDELRGFTASSGKLVVEERPKAKKPTMVVVGLLPAQEQVLSKQFSDVDFRFIDKDKSASKNYQVCLGADYVFVCTGWVSHSAVRKVEKVLGGKTPEEVEANKAKVIEVPEKGVTTLKNVISSKLKKAA